MAIASESTAIGIRRHFTVPGVHPYDEVVWERRDARITNFRDGVVAFEQLGVEVPAGWSLNATNILAQKYFRGTPGTPEREWSLRQVADRVADTITDWGVKDGYFVDVAEADAFRDELKHLIVHQKAAFNSPVWFNIGVSGVPQQASACFILAVKDSMDSILNWYTEEGVIFKGGSGSGVNLSRIRASVEPLKGGGTASGPVSFMRGADASAGTIKCLHEDTPVLTSLGVVPISQVEVGATVPTRVGPRVVLAVHDNGMRAMVRVRTELGDELLCTPEHKFLVRSAGGWTGWKSAGDLRDDDRVELDLNGSFAGRTQTLRPMGRGHHNETAHDLPETIDDAFGLWLGLLWGDGSMSVRKGAKFVALECCSTDPDVARAFEALTKTVFGPRAHIFEGSAHRGGSLSIRFSSSQVLRFLEANGLRKPKAWELNVPAAIQASPATVRAAFLAGLFEADGHVANGYAHLSTVSHQLALDVHRLLGGLGIPTKIGRIDDRRAAKGDRPVWTVRVIGAEGMRRFAKVVGFVSERKQALCESAVARKDASRFETQWVLPHLADELSGVWEASASQALRRAIAPYCRYALPRSMSLLRARALIERFPELARTSLGSFAAGGCMYVRATVEHAGVGPVYDLTVEDVHEYLVQNLVTHNSGGKTRRAAKMVILDADHPDVFDFIWCKAIEERKARALRDAGFDMDLDGIDAFSIQYQNANNSVRVTDEFMQAVIDDREWELVARTTGEPVRSVLARDLFRQIAHAAWECADPGLQYDTTINRWHTAPNAGRINASNPCSEYVHLDNSACNLASINLLKFLDRDGQFDVPGFEAATEVVFTAQEILVGNADYPTVAIAENARRYRQLGIGYANLGALLMAKGLPYDSDEGRAWAAAITAVLTGHAYETSGRIASRMGPFAGFHGDRDAMLHVLGMHRDAVAQIDDELVPTELLMAARETWEAAVELGSECGVRNAQASVLAPTGTIGLLLDCDTTGIEPDLGLVKMKKLVGGGTMSIVNQTVPRALDGLGYSSEQIEDIVAYVDEHKSIVGAPHLSAAHLPVFACSMGDNTIHYAGHIKMMGSVQPFISGAISKTINMPEEVTVEDVEQLHIDAWRLGIKAVAVYRDNCKVAQPLSTTKKESGDTAPAGSAAEAHDREIADRIADLEEALTLERRRADGTTHSPRERLPRRRRSSTFAFRVSDCEGYVTVGEYDDGRPGEVFMKVSKQGSTLAGIMDAFSISVSLGLQHGVPLATYVRKYTNMRFEPAGITDDSELRIATSLVDYIFRRLAMDYLTLEERQELGVLSTAERVQPTLPGVEESSTPSSAMIEDAGVSGVPPTDRLRKAPSSSPSASSAGSSGAGPISRQEQRDAPMCYQCGNAMQRAGSCYVCASCGTTSGCS